MNKILNEKDFYKSSDISIITTLKYYGYQIEALDKQNPSKIYFLIERDEKLDELIRKYFLHELKVDPLAFLNCLKEVKSRIYENRE